MWYAPLIEAIGSSIEWLVVGVVICAVFEFIMWRLTGKTPLEDHETGKES